MFLQCSSGNLFPHVSLLEMIVICEVWGTVNTAKFCYSDLLLSGTWEVPRAEVLH